MLATSSYFAFSKLKKRERKLQTMEFPLHSKIMRFRNGLSTTIINVKSSKIEGWIILFYTNYLKIGPNQESSMRPLIWHWITLLFEPIRNDNLLTYLLNKQCPYSSYSAFSRLESWERNFQVIETPVYHAIKKKYLTATMINIRDSKVEDQIIILHRN